MKALFTGLDERVAIAAMPIVDARAELAAEERAVFARVAEGRMREYATGRKLARELLRSLGAPHPVVTRAPDRSPRWPAGFVGSIAHTDRRCIVAVARACDYTAIGIDVEPAQGVEADLFETIATEGELVATEHMRPQERARAVRRLFTAKEAAYKCVYPLRGTFLDFHDIVVAFSTAGDRFTASIAYECELEGRFEEHEGCFHALVICPARERVSSG